MASSSEHSVTAAMASPLPEHKLPRVAPCPVRRETPAPYPPEDIAAAVLDPYIEPGSTTASRSLAIAQEHALTEFDDEPVPIDGTPGGFKLVYGFVIDNGTLMEWALRLRPPHIRLEEAETRYLRAHMISQLLTLVEEELPNTLRRIIRGLPRFQSKRFSRLPPLADEYAEGRVFVVKHNFRESARDVEVPQVALDKLKKYLGVPNQEPAWYCVDLSSA